MLCKCSGKYIDIYFILKITFCWCEENTGRHFKGFYFTKIKGMQNNNTGGIECGTQTDIKYYNFEWRLNTDATK